MITFKPFERADILKMTRLRAGETRLGQTLNSEHPSKFQIIGVPESIGVRANFGLGGTETAWPAFLQAFLHLQDNRFLRGKEVQLNGFFVIDFPPTQDIAQLRSQVEAIDTAVSKKVEEIVRAGAVPIVIGGGHNNAYPILKGCSQALESTINVINLDAHADFRPLEGRHSGNGFSYAAKDGYLGHYSILGLKKAYVSEVMLQAMDRASVRALYLEELDQDPATAINAVLAYSSSSPFGLEIDLDSIENMLSSAVSPLGVPLSLAHQLIRAAAAQLRYLHLCEGAVRLSDGREYPAMGKVLAELVATYLITAGLPAPIAGTDISPPNHSNRR